MLAALPDSARRRILATVGKLATDPRPRGTEKLKGGAGELRVRVGSYRIIYDVEDERLQVTVLKIGHRGEVYR